MKILVTGGNGFIGKYLVKNLLERGNIVTIFDDFSNSKNLDLLKNEYKKILIIKGDITNNQQVENAIEDNEIVIHLAAKISVDESIKNPKETFRINVEGTKNILNACKKFNVKKLIAASSASVYGEGIQGIKMKENSKINPISPYGESKYKMEKEIIKFSLEHGLEYVILRFFNIFGFGQSAEYSGVITKFLEKIREEKSLEIFGDGMQTRDFVSVHDVVNSIDNAMSNGKNGVYNIASGNFVTIKELADLMISFSGKKLGIEFLDSKKGDIKFSQADISLAQKEIKYSPKFDLKEIKNLIKDNMI
jgi:UDP-glucose 4-epimerase